VRHTAGSTATTSASRWQDHLPAGGIVVSNEIELTLDVEAIVDEDLERTGAIEYYRDAAEEVPSEVQAGTPDAP
jgi:hypothetical protein